MKAYKIMGATTLLCGGQKLSKELTTESQFLRSVAGRTLYHYKITETEIDPI